MQHTSKMIKEYNNKTIKVEVNRGDLEKSNVIYKLTFPNGKVYIGQTIRSLHVRIYHHCKEVSNTIKYNAINKYKSFKAEVLHQADINYLDTLEQIYIAKYKSTDINFGYNLESGGSLNKIISNETKQKLRDINLGRKYSNETKLKMSKQRSGKNNARATSIIVTEIKTGIETRFDYILEAAGYYEIADATISKALRGLQKTFKKKQYTARYE